MTHHKIVVLNHFFGMPDLMDDTCNAIRYATILAIISEANSEDTYFVVHEDKAVKNKQLHDISEIAVLNGFKWISYKDEHIDEILLKLSLELKHKVKEITPENTTIIMGGTNTSGCLLFNSNTSLNNWTKLGYKVRMYLSMCYDYETPGVNASDKNSMALARLYTFIKDNDIMDRVDISYSGDKEFFW